MTSEASIPEPPTIFIYNKVTKYDIPINVTHVKVDPSVKEIRAGAFQACQSLVEVEFSEGLEFIGKMAFEYCRGLKTIKIPSAHVVIESNAFSRCKSLVSVELPEVFK
jgi:hypothetical protein